jgi:hypothetical protein
MDERIAEITFRWMDDQRFSFIWQHELVLVHYEKDYQTYRILTDHRDEQLPNIDAWVTDKLERIRDEDESTPHQTNRD